MVLAMKLNAFFKEVKSYFYLLLSAEPTNPGSADISWGIVTTTSPLAVHIACDVGNRVHTRHDSDEDVRGNVYKQTIAWRALPWSFILQTFFLR